MMKFLFKLLILKFPLFRAMDKKNARNKNAGLIRSLSATRSSVFQTGGRRIIRSKAITSVKYALNAGKSCSNKLY